MTTAVLILCAVAFCGWFAGLAEWFRANAEQDRANDAMVFAQDALDDLEGERSKNRALSAANDRLYHCLRDRMDEDEYARLQQGVTIFDRTLGDFDAWESEL